MYRRLLLVFVLALGTAGLASAATTCSFANQGDTLRLQGDCTTDEPILVPDGHTLDGQGHTITAADPAGDHFRGGVIENAGEQASVRNVVIKAHGLKNACDRGADRLRGIFFDGASGEIRNNVIAALNQGASGCQEGNGIEVRNTAGVNNVRVDISNNKVRDWQKTGIVATGDVYASIANNDVDAAFTNRDDNGANSIQISFGASGEVVRNRVEGNQFCPRPVGATAILSYAPDQVTIAQNNVRGVADLGIALVGDDQVVRNNKVFEDRKADDCWDVLDFGIADYTGGENQVRNNKVRGYDTPYAGVSGGKNKAVPGSSVSQPFW